MGSIPIESTKSHWRLQRLAQKNLVVDSPERYGHLREKGSKGGSIPSWLGSPPIGE